MSKIKSVFGAYADKLQVIVDKSQDKFAPTWFGQYFDWGVPQTSLNFVSVIGRSRIEAAASVIARGSAAPLRSRANLEKLTGEIPAIAEKFTMSEEDYRNFFTLQQMNIADTVKKQQLLDLMFEDVKKAANATNKRLDIMCLEAISKGEISLDLTNNPDGVVLSNPISLLMSASNKTNAAVNWATSATATPITDIQTVVNAASDKGVTFAKILMSRPTWLKFIKTTEVKDLIAAYLRTTSNKVLPTLDTVNEFLQAQMYPVIEIVDVAVGVEKDGVIATIRPFADANVSFVPAGKLGKIHNAIPIEVIRPVENVNYATVNNTLISKWAQNEPFAEYTKGELNAFPGLDAIDSIYLLSTTAAF